MEKDFQLIINKMGRATTGTFQSTLRGIVLSESKLAPAAPLLDYRQASYTKRLMARPKGHQGRHGPEEILERRGTDLTERLRQSSFVGGDEKPEEMRWPGHRRFQGRVEIEPRGEALRKAKGWKDTRNSIWTDGSRLEGGKVGAAAVWWMPERVEPPWIGPVTGRTYTPGRREAGWTGRRFHLGKNKEVYDAVLYALYQAAKIFDERTSVIKPIPSSDSAAAIVRAKSDEMGPGQRFAVAIIEVRGGEQMDSGSRQPPAALQPAKRPKAPKGAPP